MDKEQQIAHYMKSLEISREEAEQLWEDDQADYIGEQGEQMSENAKKLRRYEKSDEKKERKPREKKIDTEKVEIIEYLNCALSKSEKIIFDNLMVKNEQKEITFKISSNEYSLTLTKHRPPK